MSDENKDGIGSHQSHDSGKTEWLTPPLLIEELGPFDLDPCAPKQRPWPMADEHYTIDDDGLNSEWFGRVWCNPPYGRHTGTWLERLAEHGNGIALVFARTETQMFFDQVWERADGLLFIEGRLYFHHANGEKADNNSGGPSALVAYGDDNAERLAESDLPGAALTDWSLTKRLQGSWSSKSYEDL